MIHARRARARSPRTTRWRWARGDGRDERRAFHFLQGGRSWSSRSARRLPKHNMAANIPAAQDHHPRHQRRRSTSTSATTPIIRCSATRSSCCGSSSRPCKDLLNGTARRAAARAGGDRARARGVARRWPPKHDLRRDADQPVPRDPRVHARRGSGDAIVTHDSGSPRDQICRSIAPAGRALSRLGQVAPARHGARPHHGREARRAGQVLRELHGRCRVRHDRARLRDGGARRHSDPAPSCSTTPPWRSRRRT